MSDDPAPIILLGAARSGTKFLRDVIGESAAVARVPYDTSYIWRYGNEDRSDDAFDRADATDQVKAFAPKQLRRIAGLQAGDDRRLLEKTVGNTLRVGFVDEILPTAKFIHLIRDGRAVTESAMRLWQAPPDWKALFRKLRGMPFSNMGYALWFAKNTAIGLVSGRKGGKVWGPRYPGIEEDVAAKWPLEKICAEQWMQSVRAARAGLSEIAPERQHSVRYEDLLDDPQALEALIAFLDLPDGEVVKRAFQERAAYGNLDKWQKSLTANQIATITTVIQSELDSFGYPEMQQAGFAP